MRRGEESVFEDEGGYEGKRGGKKYLKKKGG